MAARPHPHPARGRAEEVRRAAGGGHRQPLIEYLALGDSYTIGTGGAERDSFPAQLAARFERETGARMSVTNLGVNGYTTADLIREELPVATRARPDVVTCLIGVNDFVQGVSVETYQERLRLIYSELAALCPPPGLPPHAGGGVPAIPPPGLPPQVGGGVAAVVAISIPDFSFTPQARYFGAPEAIVDGLRAFNRVAAAEAASAGFTFVDIFDVSRSRAGEPGWIANDGLHPAGPQYAAWVERIWADAGDAWRRLV